MATDPNIEESPMGGLSLTESSSASQLPSSPTFLPSTPRLFLEDSSSQSSSPKQSPELLKEEDLLTPKKVSLPLF